MSQSIKIGLLGAGHLGKIHLRCLKSTPFEIVGIYDPSPEVQAFLRKQGLVKVFTSAKDLIAVVDAVDIVSTTDTHFEIAEYAISQGKHTFIEKPICTTVAEAQQLLDLAQQKMVKVQIGHVERYNPAIISIKDRVLKPRFIEGHRLSTFNERGNQVSVLLDLMIHDLDLVLQLVGSEVVDIQANGVCVVNDTPDICNARITFACGCVANLTASRISMKQMRKLRVFQENEYISVDFLKKETQIIKLEEIPDGVEVDGMTIETSAGRKSFQVDMPEIKQNNAIVDELVDFYHSITEDKAVSVDISAGMKALALAQKLEEKIISQGE